MRPVNIQKIKYHDNVASKRRHNVRVKIWSGIFVAGIIIAGIGYALFYTPWMKITTITLEGLVGGHQGDVERVINDTLDERFLSVPIGRNMLFAQTGGLEKDLLSKFSFIEKITINKDYFHTLNVSATERQAEGVWCFVANSEVPNCKFFDINGVTFGRAVQSSGVLFLNIDDLRTQPASASLATVDTRFFKEIQTAVRILKEQNIKIKNIVIPKDTYTEFNVFVSDSILSNEKGNYLIKFSLDSDLEAQLDIFRIFRNQKLVNGQVQPEYIDLRFDERVYFK